MENIEIGSKVIIELGSLHTTITEITEDGKYYFLDEEGKRWYADISMIKLDKSE